MAIRQTPKRAVWRGHRVWPWALAAALVALLAAGQLARTLLRAPPAPAPVAATTPTLPDTMARELAGRKGQGADGGPAASGRLSPPSLPTVAVLDARGAPVSDCVLELHLPGERREAGTVGADRCEVVELGAVAPGDYLLAAEAPGFVRTERPVHLAPGPSSLRLTLADGVALSGHVVDGSGTPIPDVAVAVSPTEASARTDRTGAFRVSVPGPGVYSLEAHHSDWGGAVDTVTVPAADVVLRLQPRSVLELKVLSGGRPVQGAQADLLATADSGEGRQYYADRATDEGGTVRLQGFPPGTYSLSVLRPGALWPSHQEVVLAEGPPTAVIVTLPAVPPGSIAGEVVDEAGKPVQGAWVRTEPLEVAPVQSDVEGRFRLLGVPEGVEYQLAAALDDAVSVSRPARAGDAALRLSVSHAKRYRGRVVDEAHRPIPSFRVGNAEVEANDGRFALPLVAQGGSVAFNVEAPQRAMASVVRAAAAEDLGDILLRPAPAVHGVVREADGTPAGGALVVCEGCRGEGGGERHLSALGDAQGRFTLSVTGRYGVLVRLVAFKEGRVAWAEAGRVGEGALLTLAAPAPVHGRVLGPRGNAAPGVAVVFSEPLLEPLQLVTGVDGTFSGQVPPGLYQVTLMPEGSRPRRTWTVQVPTERPLELSTGATPR